MGEAAKLTAAVAALVGAMAWPIFFAAILIIYRKEIRAFLGRIPTIFDRMRRVKAAGFEAELDKLADKAPTTGEITLDQARVAAQFVVTARDVGIRSLLQELDTLCLEYDTLRRTMPASFDRTREMTRIVAKMRALAPSTSTMIDVYKGSGSAGSRLAAIAMMQMEPAKADIPWLAARFNSDLPFIFYHAALALTNVANSGNITLKAEAIAAARSALNVIQSFIGEPDRGTLDVLEALARR